MVVQLSQARTCQSNLLNKLSDEDYQPLLPLLDMVETKHKDEIYRQGDEFNMCTFPVMVSFPPCCTWKPAT